MFHPLNQTDAMLLTSVSSLLTPRGTLSVTNNALIFSDNYIVTLPISMSAHSGVINIMINGSPFMQQTNVSGPRHSIQPVDKNIDIRNPNFENYWVHVGALSTNSISSVVNNIPTRWLRLEGADTLQLTAGKAAFIVTNRMVTGH